MIPAQTLPQRASVLKEPTTTCVGTAALGCPAEGSSAEILVSIFVNDPSGSNFAEEFGIGTAQKRWASWRSLGQPRAAVPT
jgi:hypothetical protein